MRSHFHLSLISSCPNPTVTVLIHHHPIGNSTSPPSTQRHRIQRRFDRRSNQISSAKSVASNSTTIADNPIVASTSEEDEIQAKVGARVRVTVPLKVYHVPKVPEVDLNGPL
ncbi:ferredoxin-thioredoxin reductase, variable chain, chloroplastic-like [Helianthus annuus]|uniref:ferredoxin-thioredoxin reductase, variable chain, chloroplastic-like n=1 Tax=Helianthus annuus TaxID=4232 RepID=UPI000B904825|nr:ferredoxin-thioredoxin reductase, variable chain, chloroplastic-like [Helianthus annuus]